MAFPTSVNDQITDSVTQATSPEYAETDKTAAIHPDEAALAAAERGMSEELSDEVVAIHNEALALQAEALQKDPASP